MVCRPFIRLHVFVPALARHGYDSRAPTDRMRGIRCPNLALDASPGLPMQCAGLSCAPVRSMSVSFALIPFSRPARCQDNSRHFAAQPFPAVPAPAAGSPRRAAISRARDLRRRGKRRRSWRGRRRGGWFRSQLDAGRQRRKFRRYGGCSFRAFGLMLSIRFYPPSYSRPSRIS